jgi:hypothetical protein
LKLHAPLIYHLEKSLRGTITHPSDSLQYSESMQHHGLGTQGVLKRNPFQVREKWKEQGKKSLSDTHQNSSEQKGEKRMD